MAHGQSTPSVQKTAKRSVLSFISVANDAAVYRGSNSVYIRFAPAQVFMIFLQVCHEKSAPCENDAPRRYSSLQRRRLL